MLLAAESHADSINRLLFLLKQRCLLFFLRNKLFSGESNTSPATYTYSR